MVSMDTDGDETPQDDVEDPWADVRKHPKKSIEERYVGRKPRGAYDVRTGKMLNKQRMICETLAATGLGVFAVLDELKIPRATYRAWRNKSQDFRLEVEQAKIAGLAKLTGEEPMTAGQSDFADFRRKHFGFETWPFQQEIIDRLETPVSLRTVSLTLVPPFHGKSTLMVDWICYKLALDPNYRIIIVSASQRHARKMIGQVKNRMTNPQLSQGVREYIAKYGPFYEANQERDGKPWAADMISVHKANNDEKDYSLEALGWNGQIYGARCDQVIGDDIQTIDSLNQTDKIKAKIQQDVISRPSIRGGRINFVGTRVGPGDVYEAMIDENIVSKNALVLFPARKDDGSPLEPNMYTDEELTEIEAQAGPQAWATSYMMRPSAGTDASFSDVMIEEAKNDMVICNERPKGQPVVMSLDPALGGGNAIMAAAWTQDHLTFFDCQLDYGLSRNEDIYNRIDQMATRHRPQTLIVETTALQRGLARAEGLREIAKKHGFHIVEHDTAGKKQDPILGVAQMPSSFIRNEISIANGDPISKSRMQAFCLQLMAWRPNVPVRHLKQDTVMASWFIWKWWMERRRRDLGDADQWDSAGLPWTPSSVGDERLLATGGGW
jgi:hypothetical protein